ncbi:MAG: tRNA (adenosine(37)-N6)-threonylcarbamoyltransferase complex ATPase subunit type 1 TsaE [Planctomycetota bacterium]|nr:MAG: tRNA (adenosine(37)-N6)-threonylcarbamoyltransferase complex ATPase subunit type 1 TsaE [Planctomycetota bacterium]
MSSERFAHATPFALPDVAATHALAARLAQRLPPGGVLALVGELGAGKTEFTRGFARALGVPAEQPVSSPSFVLLQIYEGTRGTLAHFDAYFAEGEFDLEQAGFHDLRKQGARVIIEWAERVAELIPEDSIWLQLEHDAPGRIARLVGAPREERAC